MNLLTGFNNTHAGPGQSTLLTIVDFGADVGHMMEAFLDILPQFSHVPLVLVLLCDEDPQKEWLEHKAVTPQPRPREGRATPPGTVITSGS